MSHDTIADALNQIMNAKKSGKVSLKVNRYSKILISILKIARDLGYIKSYKIVENELEIEIGELKNCRAIKPRYEVKTDKIEKYMRRYLPARDIGVIIISTNKGIMTHQEAIEKNLGGALIVYFY